MRPYPLQKVTPCRRLRTHARNELSGKRLLIFGRDLAGPRLPPRRAGGFAIRRRIARPNFGARRPPTLIRDAPRVTLRSDAPSTERGRRGRPRTFPATSRSANGFTHLRNALLEDASFDWTAAGPADTNWSNSLVFAAAEGAEPRAVVMFSPDFKWAAERLGRRSRRKHAVATTAECAARPQEVLCRAVAGHCRRSSSTASSGRTTVWTQSAESPIIRDPGKRLALSR